MVGSIEVENMQTAAIAVPGRSLQRGRTYRVVRQLHLWIGAWGAIADLREVFDGAGLPFFFAAGTALGLVREGRPLSADADIDVGVNEADWDRDALIEIFTRHPRFELDLHPLTSRVSLRHRGGSPIDVFRRESEAGRSGGQGQP